MISTEETEVLGKKTCPVPILSARNVIWTALVSAPIQRPMTNTMSHGTANLGKLNGGGGKFCFFFR